MSVGSETTVFLSYRREDTPFAVGRLGDAERAVRQGVHGHRQHRDPGVDFTAVIRQAVGECDILLALIGDKWSNVVDDIGRLRLEHPEDWVVQEIRVALDRGVRVIPVLVDAAPMPRRTELPEALAPLVKRPAVPARPRCCARLGSAAHRRQSGAERSHLRPRLCAGSGGALRRTVGVCDRTARRAARSLPNDPRIAERLWYGSDAEAAGRRRRTMGGCDPDTGAHPRRRSELSRRRRAARQGQGSIANRGPAGRSARLHAAGHRAAVVSVSRP